MTVNNASGIKKFFIVGCPRSGTTMVQQALNRHPAIAIPPETKFFFSFIGQSRHRQERHLERLKTDLRIQLQVPSSGIDSEPAGREFYEDMARRYVERVGKTSVEWFGEKTPEHTGHLGRIRRLFPDSKIVVLYRDGRDVALSLAAAPWMAGGLYVSFLVWLYYQGLIARARSTGLPNVHYARYEDVVMDPEREFAAILRFLELPYDSQVVEGYGNTEGIPAREYPWKAHALRKINPSRVGSFRTTLTGTQVAILERLGRRTLTEFGYPLLTRGDTALPLSLLCRLPGQLAVFLAHLPWQCLVQELAELMFV